ncbi:MAG: HEAT repeat domain-containing protein [Verrucomicrobiota bacterium]
MRISLLALLMLPAMLRADDFNPRKATLDELFVEMRERGHTKEKRLRKGRARAEFFARKGKGLRYLMTHIHHRNIYLRIYAEPLVKQLKAREGVPVLLDFLDAEHAATRRYATFYLGYFDTPEHADRLMALLEDRESRKFAIRTLGKWKVKEAVPEIVEALKEDKELMRIMAANALRDMADPRGAEPLIAALDDDLFTVRKTAARALAALGEDAPVIAHLGKAEGRVLRELIRTLGEMKSSAGLKKLETMKDHPDAQVRREVENAVRLIRESGES